MQVVTFTPSLLSAACCQLARQVMESGFIPEVVIGICNGGAQVARSMTKLLPAEALYCEVSISRPSTLHKRQTYTHRLLRHLPLWLCDVLRMLESRVAAYRSSQVSPERIGNLELSPEVTSLLNTRPGRVLIIDDAIDSGATMQKVCSQLQARFPDAQIRLAAITVTTQHPVVDADYSLYHNSTLCRFPWSNDYRGEQT